MSRSMLAQVTRRAVLSIFLQGLLFLVAIAVVPNVVHGQRAPYREQRKASPGDSLDVVLALVPKLDSENAVIEIYRTAKVHGVVFLRITESATPKDLAQALHSVAASASSTFAMGGGELRAYVYATADRRQPSPTRAQQATALLTALRVHGRLAAVPGSGSVRTINHRIALVSVAVQR